jgi:hypothetical protein
MATSGHYIAHIKDERTGDWWQFDDEVVTSLGAHPLREAAAAAGKADSKKEEDGDTEKEGGAKEEEQGGGDEEKEAGGEGKGGGIRPLERADPNMLTSADSYMLMYRRRDERQVAVVRRQEERRQRKAEAAAREREPKTVVSDGARKENKRTSVEVESCALIEKVPKRARTGRAPGKEVLEGVERRDPPSGTSAEPIAVDSPLKDGQPNGAGVLGNGRERSPMKMDSDSSPLEKQTTDGSDADSVPEVPSMLVQEVENDNAAFLSAVEAYKTERERIEAEVGARRREVRETLTSAAAGPAEWDFRWISTEWLRCWADSKDPPGPIDNTPLLCEHNKLPPQSVPLMKRINKETWAELEKRHGGGPELSAGDGCEECIRRDADVALSADSFRTRRTAMREQLEQELALGAPGTHYVSKSWLVVLGFSGTVRLLFANFLQLSLVCVGLPQCLKENGQKRVPISIAFLVLHSNHSHRRKSFLLLGFTSWRPQQLVNALGSQTGVRQQPSSVHMQACSPFYW